MAPLRWLYYDPLNVQEVAHRTATLARFHAFWQAFGAKVSVLERALSGGTAWDWHRWLNQLLREVDDRFCWEIFPSERPDQWRMAFSVESHRAARLMLRDFVAAAPQTPGWSFHPWRVPMAYPTARRWARQRSGADCDHLAVNISRGTARNLNLLFAPLPDAPPGSQQKWLTLAYSASEAILGEEVLDRYIGSVSMAPPAEARAWWRKLRRTSQPSDWLSMSQLAEHIEECVAELRSELPSAPLAKLLDSRGWTTVEVTPTSEIPDTRRHDLRLLTASVASLAPLTAAHRSEPFFSTLHSNYGETFCYVQWEHGESDDNALLTRRDELEQSIAQALAEHNGCVIGGGIGEKYLYFDLALTELEQSIPSLRRALLPHQPPLACWLLFFDEELAEEWVGIHPNAMAPAKDR